MKTILKSIFLLFISFSCFSQNSEKENLDLVFYNNCSDKIIKPEFEIDSFPELNYKIITVYIKRGNLIGQYSTTLKTNNDTIRIPEVLFSFESVLHSKNWNYMNCDKICHGTETDFYSNGNKRLEGIFENGKPIEIKDYRKNGELLTQTFYENLTLNYKRVNYFDSNGELIEYEVYKNKKRKTIIRTFDKNGILINKETEKNYLEKTKL
jgi:antitoxin component YwqK of YwqJK toxin-antitoxin module